MNFRKFLLTLFIVLSLNFSYQSANTFLKEKNSIVFIINTREDSYANDFINTNQIRKHNILVSLTLNLMIIDHVKVFNNSS